MIDELLAFVQNKISINNDDSLAHILLSSCKSDEIKRPKSLLFESLPTDKRHITRKIVGKETRDLEDIISLFRGSNSEMRTVVGKRFRKTSTSNFRPLRRYKNSKRIGSFAVRNIRC